VFGRRKHERVPPNRDAVVDRVLCVSVVAMLGAIVAGLAEGAMDDARAGEYVAESHRWLRREQLADALTIGERHLIAKSLADWSERESVAAGWRSESAGVLLWALSAFAAFGDLAHVDGRREPRRIELGRVREVEQVGAFARQEHRIHVLAAGIAREVVVRTELERIDEDRDDRESAGASGELHEGQVPLVQRSHRRDEGDELARAAGLADRGAQRLQLAGGDQCTRRSVVAFSPLKDSARDGNSPAFTSFVNARAASWMIPESSA